MCTTLIIETARKTKETGPPVAVVSGRTMEFGFDLDSKVRVVPRGTKVTPTLPDGNHVTGTKPGKPYKTEHGMIGTDALGMDTIVDGINEHGLYFSALYFPGSAEYGEVSNEDGKTYLAPHDLGIWLLGTCRTVAEVETAIKNVVLVKTVVEALGGPPPVHFIVRDPTGRAMVIEPIGGALKTHENKVSGVMTNSPSFDWHVQNLVNYRALQPENVASVVLGGGHELPLFGQGSGMFGLPGDSTPPSRFVRAVAFAQTAVPTYTAHDTVLQMFHIMNNFDIPVGSITETHPGENGKPPVVHRDYTSWTVVADLTNRKYYFRTYDDQSIRVVDVARTLETVGSHVQSIEMKSKQPIVDMTGIFHRPL
jgi:choloylglycine hydrolase